MDRSEPDLAATRDERAEQPAADPALPLSVQGPLSGVGRSQPRCRTLARQLEHLVDEVDCYGLRRQPPARRRRGRAAAGRTIDELCRMPLGELMDDFSSWKLDAPRAKNRRRAGPRDPQPPAIPGRRRAGISYACPARPTLSGGEAQRIRLASQVGSGLCGVLYVLDEPTIGLHPRDNRRLLGALRKLRDLGNTLLLVEHDREVIAGADHLLDFGPAAGDGGGEIVARGTPDQVAQAETSVTGPYLSGKKAIAVPTNRRMAAIGGGESARPAARVQAQTRRQAALDRRQRRGRRPRRSLPPGGGWLEVIGARHNNLQNVDVRIPLGTLTVVTGVSGSGKSSLVEDVLYNSLARTLHRAKTCPAAPRSIRGVEQINKVIRVDQQPIGNTPTSNPATYTGVFDLIRQLYAQLPEAKLRGYTPRRFSFNVPGGRCEECEGNGQLRIEMHFLPDVWVECDTCRGRRYNPETLAVCYHGQSIADVLDMPCGRGAASCSRTSPRSAACWKRCATSGSIICTLGQPAPTLSGGEAQRVKLAAELARPDTGRTLYLLDEPTTGLHFDDWPGCSTCSIAWSIWAIRSSSSSTIST